MRSRMSFENSVKAAALYGKGGDGSGEGAEGASPVRGPEPAPLHPWSLPKPCGQSGQEAATRYRSDHITVAVVVGIGSHGS